MATRAYLDCAGRWFLSSGIQEPSGGVARYYRAESGQNLPISTEITAYAASTLVYLYSLTGAPQYLERAERAAAFLTRTAWDAERQTFPFECNGHRPLAYFFDCGIIVRGLLAVWRQTGRTDLLEVARTCAYSMARDFSDADGGFHPILTLPEKQPLAHEAQWSRGSGCYQLKAALAWDELAAATGDTGLRLYYQRQLESALATHETFLPGDPDLCRVMDRLHAYCYFLEGLLPVAGLERGAVPLRQGIARVAKYCREIGPSFLRSDVCAQLLRARCYAAWAGVSPMDREAATREADQLRRFQMTHVDPRIDGGVAFARRQGSPLPHINPVSAGFALQALALWDHFTAGAPVPPSHTLI